MRERAVESDDKSRAPQLNGGDTANFSNPLGSVRLVAVLDELGVALLGIKVVAVVQQHGVERAEFADPCLVNDGT